MTNLADLLPAGGGQNNTEFVADGNISAGAPVILTAAGKAAPIVSSAAAFGSEYEFESGITYYTVFNYNTTQDRVVAFYSDMSNGDYPTAVVGSISGSVITWGTPVVIISSAMSDYLAATYDANLDKHLVIFKSSSQGKALMGTVTAATNTISFGATETFSTDNVSNFDCMYDPSTTKSLIVWRDSGSSPASSAVVATPASDSSISFGSVLDWTYGTAYAQDICCAYDTNQNKVVVGAWEIPANYEIANYVATISGTSVTFGARQQAYSTSSHHGYYNNTAMDYDKSANAIVNFWRESSAGKCIAGTISGDSISYGSATAVGSDTEMQHAIYSDQSSSIALSYFASSTTYLQFFSTSGTTITVGSQITTDSAAWQYNANVYDPDTKAIIVGGTDGGDSSKGKSKVYEQDPSNLTSTNLLGLAPEAISDTATGTINTWGSRCKSSKLGGVGFSMGATVQFAATNLPDINASQAVFDSTNNKMVIVYDGAGSGAGYGIVGTISGTSISYGSAVQFSGGNAHYSRAAYDSTNQRVVVAYRDTNNSGYGTAVVGTVSGTSISWGTPVAFESSSIFFTCVSFDSNEGKVVITWKSSVAYATSIVGTVSGTSISFGSAVILDLSYGYNKGSVTYDPNAQRHLYIAERTAGTVTDSYVGTVSGTSISWGSAVSLTTTQYFYDSFSAYEAPSQKLGVVFTNASDSTLGTLVATISGSSVSYGSLVNIGAGAYTAPGIYYDATAAEFVVQGVLSNDLLAYRGTISGTTISWGAAQTVAADADFGYGVGVPGYDTNAGKGLFQWANAAGTASDSGVATIGDLDLTIGTDYYVQTDGTLSTDTGGQLIGNAIKTNQINIKDYTG